MASTDPCPMGPAVAAVLDLASQAEEVFRVGSWSVRRLHHAEVGLIYVDEEAGRVEVQPPPEVLKALDLDADGGDVFGPSPGDDDGASPRAGGAGSDAGGSSSSSSGPPRGAGSDDHTAATADSSGTGELIIDVAQEGAGGAAAAAEEEGSAASGSPQRAAVPPRFRRIILGAKTEVPLRMARDILEALREDSSIFEEVQRRFSDAPGELPLTIEEGLGEELEGVAMSLQLGEVSDVLGTEAGMQILMRVC